MNTFDTLFQRIGQFVPLDAEEKAYLVSRLEVSRVKKRQVVLQKGEICTHRTFVQKGLLRSYVEDQAGNLHVLKFATEGWWIEDLASFLYNKPASLTIDALEDSELLQINRKDIEEVYAKSPAMERYFRVELERYTIAQQERLLMNVSMDGQEKYSFFQHKCHHLTQRLPQHLIASFLGITPQFLSQIRARLAKGEYQVLGAART